MGAGSIMNKVRGGNFLELWRVMNHMYVRGY